MVEIQNSSDSDLGRRPMLRRPTMVGGAGTLMQADRRALSGLKSSTEPLISKEISRKGKCLHPLNFQKKF